MKNTKNVLLSKGELGQVKPGFHDLPKQGHVYGWQPEKDKYGAREVISNWQYHKPSGVGEPSKDFKALNKNGVIQGCTNSKDISNFRQTADVRVKVKEGQKFFDIRLPPEDFVYGIPNRPSTPIKNVVCNTYAKQSDNLEKEREAVMKVLGEENHALHPDNHNQAHHEVKHKVNRKEEIERNNFKLGKFKNVESKIKAQINKSKS